MSGADYFVPTFIMKINDQRISQEMAADVMNITTEEKIGLPTLFTMVLSDRELIWIDDQDLVEGSSVKVEMGYLNETVEIFDGEITGLQANYLSDGPVTLAIRGYDCLHRLARNKQTRTFADMQDSDIAREIAGEVSLQLKADQTNESHEYILQNAQTNLDFLKERCERLGFELAVQGTTLYFREPQDDEDKTVTLEWGKTLMELNMDMSSVGQVSSVEVRGWDPAKQTVISGEANTNSNTMGGTQSGAQIAEDAFGESVQVIVDNTVKSQEEADNMASERFREIGLNYICGDGRCLGDTNIRTGKIIELKSVGEKLNGKYYVVGTKHELSKGGYVTSFRVKRNSR